MKAETSYGFSLPIRDDVVNAKTRRTQRSILGGLWNFFAMALRLCAFALSTPQNPADDFPERKRVKV